MKILVIDGQGGGLGKSIVSRLKAEKFDIEIIAVGTNSVATSLMLKSGATYAATGENAIVYNCKKSDIIIGALGIGFANSMHGEITPLSAKAVSESDAHKILIPVSKCNISVVGVIEKPLSQYIDDMVSKIRNLLIM